ncbi:alkaline phosphatase [Pedobacter sp. PACM 27299]|uniref:choice-of-anchor I family protein n=1 Tax=Pedobacter sp. PACM 27299 TaxID=1727164 RepID=UPI000705F6C2|nr:choice-of-anchor I family protein [Pedobacter sp. PACM 27299]ALL05213.1 alkaline phosphatase [Pedobacter sp. PACM 27299]
MNKNLLFGLLLIAALGCKKAGTPTEEIPEVIVNEDAGTFAEIGSYTVGGAGAAEITAFDPSTNRLFVVNNTEGNNRIEVIDFKDPAAMKSIGSIPVAPYGGLVNSVSVHDGKLAAAIESTNKQENGKVVVFKTSDYSEIKVVSVGALPDMVTFSPDGKYILSANEGEPNDAYTVDPAGTVSIISVANNYAVNTIDFSAFTGQKAALMSKGFRVFGPGNDFLKGIEPEYITVSEDSKTAWVTLQENNAIAKINIDSKTITDIFPLGFKDYNLDGNEIDPSDKDNATILGKWKVKGMYLPDAIGLVESGGIPYLFTANEGDAREYGGFSELQRIKDKSIVLDPTAFPNASLLKKDEQLGRLNITTTLGDTDGDGDYDELYSFGARSFSAWNGNTGMQVYDSKNELDVKTIAAGFYDETRSDDKSVEPEGIAIGSMGSKKIAFVGMERADAVAVYDVSSPAKPVFLQLLKTGDAPEGVLFIAAKNSPTKKSLLLVSSEGDGQIKVYSPKTL